MKIIIERWQKLAGILEQVDILADRGIDDESNNSFEDFNIEDKNDVEEFDLVNVDLGQMPEPNSFEDLVNSKDGTEPEDMNECLLKYVSYLRAIHLWFHAGHHLTKGTGFSGDHVELYTKIYTEVQEEIDGAIEKAIGVTEDEALACPLMITKNAISIMEKAGCQVNASAQEIAEAGLRLEKDYLDFLETMFEQLENSGMLTLGLNDQLAASANSHETYVYLLSQRVKTELDE